MARKPASDTPPDPPAAPATAPDVAASSLVRVASSDETDTLAALAAAGLDVGDASEVEDGLAEILPSDLRTPKKLWNLKKADGVTRIAQDQFLDTIDRTVSDALNLVLLDIHKTHLYEVYNGERNVTQCSSYDRVLGTWVGESARIAVGTVRPCKGCPDQVWRDVQDAKTGQRKREQPCSEVWNVAAFDIDAGRVCLLTFKKTSLNAIRMHVQAHHIGRLPRPGQRPANIPLCVYRVRVTLEMDRAGNYAVPKLERGARLAAAEIKLMHDTALGVRETFEARMRVADESARGDEPAGDTSFDPAALDEAGAGAGGERGHEAFVE